MSKRTVHKSHRMSKWRSAIISTEISDRFGEIRNCKHCNAEQAKTVTGTHTHQELYIECPNRK